MKKVEVLKILESLAYDQRIIGVIGDTPVDGYKKVLDYEIVKQFVSMIEETK